MFGIDWYYYALFGFAIIWPFIARVVFGRSISGWELLINISAVTIVIYGVLQIGRSAEMSDIEIWNGEVTGKARVEVSCDHSYECFCSYDEDGNKHCTTCYEHNNDWDYEVYSNIGDFRIDRIDSRGIQTPERWAAVTLKEPVSRQNRYTNYIKGIGRSYFATENLTDEYAGLLPNYPSAVYDYYRVDRVITANVEVPSLEEWNQDLAERLRVLGPEKQANVVIVFADTDNPGYRFALQQHWLGGKKNDVVVILGTPNFPQISWAGVFTLSENEFFASKLAKELESLGTVRRSTILTTVESALMTSYSRLPMESFQSLRNKVKPPIWSIILAGFFCIFGSVGLSIIFHRHEVV